MTRVAVIGEVGMDYTQSFKVHNPKEKPLILEEVASEVWGLNKPLVVRCRGGHEERSATLDCLTILGEVLPK